MHQRRRSSAAASSDGEDEFSDEVAFSSPHDEGINDTEALQSSISSPSPAASTAGAGALSPSPHSLTDNPYFMRVNMMSPPMSVWNVTSQIPSLNQNQHGGAAGGRSQSAMSSLNINNGSAFSPSPSPLTPSSASSNNNLAASPTISSPTMSFLLSPPPPLFTSPNTSYNHFIPHTHTGVNLHNHTATQQHGHGLGSGLAMRGVGGVAGSGSASSASVLGVMRSAGAGPAANAGTKVFNAGLQQSSTPRNNLNDSGRRVAFDNHMPVTPTASGTHGHLLRPYSSDVLPDTSANVAASQQQQQSQPQQQQAPPLPRRLHLDKYSPIPSSTVVSASPTSTSSTSAESSSRQPSSTTPSHSNSTTMPTTLRRSTSEPNVVGEQESSSEHSHHHHIEGRDRAMSERDRIDRMMAERMNSSSLTGSHSPNASPRPLHMRQRSHSGVSRDAAGGDGRGSRTPSSSLQLPHRRSPSSQQLQHPEPNSSTAATSRSPSPRSLHKRGASLSHNEGAGKMAVNQQQPQISRTVDPPPHILVNAPPSVTRRPSPQVAQSPISGSSLSATARHQRSNSVSHASSSNNNDTSSTSSASSSIASSLSNRPGLKRQTNVTFQQQRSPNDKFVAMSTSPAKETPTLPTPPPMIDSGETKEASSTPAASSSASSSSAPTSSPTHNRSASASSTITPPRVRIFDHFLVLGCSPTPSVLEQNLKQWTETPKVLLKFPHHSTVDAPPDVANFAFPSDVKLMRIDITQSATGLNSILYGSKQFQRGENCHIFLLKSSTPPPGPSSPNPQSIVEPEDMYGICVSAREMASLQDTKGNIHDVSCPITYCIISRFPFFELHQAVILQILMLLHLKRVKHLGEISNQAVSGGEGNGTIGDSSSSSSLRLPRGKPLGPHQVPACVNLLKKYYDSLVPAKGTSLILPAPKLLDSIVFQRPLQVGRNETSTLIAQWCQLIAWTHLTPESLLDLLECALREFKIIVCDANLCMLSCAVYSFLPLLRPLKWCGIFLPILPNKLSEFLEAPVPIIAGVTSLPSFFSHPDIFSHPDTDQTMIWYPSQNKFLFHKSFKRYLPGRNAVIAALKPHFLELRRLNSIESPQKTLPHQLPYVGKPESHAHIKIMLHLIESELVNFINYVRSTQRLEEEEAEAAAAGSAPQSSNRRKSQSRDPTMEPFIERFRQTQMLSHYLQLHQHDEADY